MKKRSLSVLLSLLLSLVLVACGTSTNTGSEQNVVQTDHEHDHEHGEFEWIGEFEFVAGEYLFHFGECEDETMDVGFIKMGDNITDLEHHASHLMLTDKEIIKQDSNFVAKPDYAYTFEMNEDHGHIHFTIEEDGRYAIVTEHMPFESSMQIFDENNVEILPEIEHEANHYHEH